MRLRKPTGYEIAVLAVFAFGVALRTYEFARMDSLWSDELSIALNVTRRGWWQLLTTPLGYGMVAPVGFLAAEKLGVTLLGSNEAGLRLFPWLASIAALYLFWRLSARYLDRLGRVGALALFALSPALLWYARNAKQYSSDVLVVLVLLLLAVRFEEGGRGARESALVAILGGIAILFSHPAVLVAAGLGCVLLVECWKVKEPYEEILSIGIGWGLAAAVAIAFSIVLTSPQTWDFMSAAWKGAWFPVPWNSWSDFFWLPRRVLAFVGFFVGLFRPDTALEIVVAGSYCVLAAVGLPRLMRRTPATAVLLLVPPVVGIVASIFRVLPFSGRLSIYIAPSLVIFAFGGLERIRDAIGPGLRRGMVPVAVFLGLAPGLILPIVLPRLNHRQPSREVLESMHADWRREDSIHVSFGGRRAMSFYGPGLGMRRWSAALRTNADRREWLREADVVRGSERAWYVSGSPRRCEEPTVLAYLDSIGSRILEIPDPYGNKGMNETSAYLYAIDRGRAARFSPETYVLPPCPELRKSQVMR